jgi:hypothetical protein
MHESQSLRDASDAVRKAHGGPAGCTRHRGGVRVITQFGRGRPNGLQNRTIFSEFTVVKPVYGRIFTGHYGIRYGDNRTVKGLSESLYGTVP